MLLTLLQLNLDHSVQLAATEARDVASFHATITLHAALATTESRDVAVFRATAGIAGALVVTEARDVAAFVARATTEARDIASFVAAALVINPARTLIAPATIRILKAI